MAVKKSEAVRPSIDKWVANELSRVISNTSAAYDVDAPTAIALAVMQLTALAYQLGQIDGPEISDRADKRERDAKADAAYERREAKRKAKSKPKL